MVEGRKLHQKRQLEVKKEVEKSKKINKEVKQDLKDVYCGAKKPGKGKRIGTETECQTKGQI